MKEKELFKSIVKSTIHRDGIEKLMDALEFTDFYTAPASTQYHDSVESGLLHHSLKVYSELCKDELASRYDKETIAIVSLFHDLCKVGFYTVEMRNKKDENGKWIQVPYYTIDDKYPFGHGDKSVDMLRDFMSLSTDEKLAIRWHMGIESNMSYGDSQAMSKVYNEIPLAVILHLADMRASYI